MSLVYFTNLSADNDSIETSGSRGGLIYRIPSQLWRNECFVNFQK